MDVSAIVNPVEVSAIDRGKLRVGERLLVEVVQKTGENEGTVRVKGRNLPAILETVTSAGDKFLAKVAEIRDGSIVLIREPLGDKTGELRLFPQQIPLMIERGLPENQTLLALAKAFPDSPELLAMLLKGAQGKMPEELLQALRQAIPNWSMLGGENGAEKLVESLKLLGLNYEQRVQLLLKMDEPAKEIEKDSLKETFKFKLLELLQNQGGKGQEAVGRGEAGRGAVVQGQEVNPARPGPEPGQMNQDGKAQEVVGRGEAGRGAAVQGQEANPARPGSEPGQMNQDGKAQEAAGRGETGRGAAVQGQETGRGAAVQGQEPGRGVAAQGQEVSSARPGTEPSQLNPEGKAQEAAGRGDAGRGAAVQGQEANPARPGAETNPLNQDARAQEAGARGDAARGAVGQSQETGPARPNPETNPLNQEGKAQEPGGKTQEAGSRTLEMSGRLDLRNVANQNQLARELEATLRAETNRAERMQSEQSRAQAAPVENMLDRFSGQQMWLKSGGLENAFVLLFLPLFNQKEQPVPAKIAIESARKGTKMDEHHCRIAVQVETENLGEVGVDAFFDQDSLSFRVLTRYPELVPALVEEAFPETKARFSRLGFTLRRIETGDLDENVEFQNFLRGNRRSGVDVRG